MEKAVGVGILVGIFASLGLLISWAGDERAGSSAADGGPLAVSDAPAPAAAPAERRPPSLHDQMLEEGPIALQSVRDSLLDPESARFRNVFTVKYKARSGETGLLFCGEVTGRNGFGGYGGFQPFLTLGQIVYTRETSTVFDGMFQDFCLDGEFVAHYPL